MNDLKIFKYEEHEVRTILVDSEPWWVLKDICDVLGLGSPHKVAERLDDDEKGRNQIPTLGGTQEMVIINESGLYNVILRSDKPNAKAFRKWVTSEVLPSIRKRGIYATAETVEAMLNDPDTVIVLLTELKAEREKRARLENRIGEMRPKEIFADAVSASKTTILVGELAKILKQNGVEMGQNRLFEWLRVNGFLINRRGTDYNMPTQYSMERGLFEIKETSITHPNGHAIISKTPKVTGKGQVYFVNRIKAEGFAKPTP